MSRSRFQNLLLLASLMLAATALVTACGEAGDGGEPALDDETSSFNIGKADAAAGGFSACELREVLELVNESSTTAELLKTDIAVHSRAANAVVAHRVGPDGIDGTRDDDLFDDLAELDGVAWVGPKALESFAAYASPRCEIDLTTRPFIHEGTFDRSTGGGWGRNAPEFEATMTITGATPRELYDVVNGEDDKGRPMFNRLRRGKIMEAFTYGYAIDEMPWDGDSADAREELPYLALSIENGNFVPDEDDDRERELDMGTDYFDDTYFDTKDYALYSEGVVLRGRARWDTLDEVRRLLIQAKSASSIDENGIKSAAKVDIRNDSASAAEIASLSNDVMGGTTSWSGRELPAEPIKSVYDQLDSAGKLPDIGDYKKVLVLDPKAHLRSKRSRFHFNFTDDANLERFYGNGLERIEHAVTYAEAALAAGLVPADATADVEALIAMGRGIGDGTLIGDRAAEPLRALDPALDAVPRLPQDFGGVRFASQNDLEAHRIVAESAEALFDEFADALDGVDRDLTASRDLDDYEDYVELYIDFQKSLDASLKAKQTVRPFAERYHQFVEQGEASVTTQIETFNLYRDDQIKAGNGDFEKVEPMTREAFDALGPLLDFEMLKISQRMIVNAGTVSHALWFEAARKFYVPGASDSAWTNFLIDTFDVTYFVTHDEWERIPEGERTPATELPGHAIFHTTVVNEVQIELTLIEPYTTRIEELQSQIASSGSTPELEAQLAGARFILDESIRALQVISELKGDDIIDELEDADLKDVQWVPASYSKGITAMRILTDTDDGNP